MSTSGRRLRGWQVLAACVITTTVYSTAWGQSKPAADRGGRGLLRLLTTPGLSSGGMRGGGSLNFGLGAGGGLRPWRPARPVVVFNSAYSYTQEASTLHLSPGGYDLARLPQVNVSTTPVFSTMPSAGSISPARDFGPPTPTFGIVQRPIAGSFGTAPIVPSAAAPASPASGTVAASVRPVRDARGFFIEQADRDSARDRKLGVALGRGEMAFENGRYDEARAEFTRAVLTCGEDAVARLSIGLAAFAQGQYADAADSLREGMAMSPETASNYPVRRRYGRTEDFDAHLAGLEAHLSARPNDADAWLVRAFICNATGNAAGAGAAAAKYATLAGDEPQAQAFIDRLRRPADPAGSADPAGRK